MAEVARSYKYKLNNEQLRELNVSKDADKIKELGGIEEIAERLFTDAQKGLAESESELNDRISCFGPNQFEEPPSKNYFQLLWNSLKEPILILLSVCAIIEIILGTTLEENGTGWIDGVAILIAVILVSNVTAGTDYDKERKFRALNSVKKRS
eukprot:TRINITY_DN17074_c0_g2_i1.p1 TRINITY_DN17074_c0_g2~~TRINITY_DN17074_c0_g2_i1.p1  ORF type:complete len:153 (-),score=40.56 TRINITY_DN17074_c0_g2_i1:45-503(-)